jgi:hypothetical protein
MYCSNEENKHQECTCIYFVYPKSLLKLTVVARNNTFMTVEKEKCGIGWNETNLVVVFKLVSSTLTLEKILKNVN